MELKSMIIQANKRGGWQGDTPPTEFGPFLGIYRAGHPNSDIPTTIMSFSQFADFVKRTIGTDTPTKLKIAQSIIAIAIREQAGKGGLVFPDHNPFGFNAFKGSWRSIRPFIKGIFLAKDRIGWAWFLGFHSLSDSIKAIAIVLYNKGFHEIQSPEDFVKLYIRKWWSPTKDENELQKIIQKETPALVSIWRRAESYVG